MGKYLAAFAASYFTLVLIKDGTLGSLFQDAANGGKDLVRGLKPITSVG